MWDKLRKQINVERQLLEHLIERQRSLLDKSATTPPSNVELLALAAALHSFYSGVENLFKRIAEELDGGFPRGEFWHRQLLDSMSRPGKARPAVISPVLVERLDAYLDFRHFFRHSYVFLLEWERMKTLVLGWEETLRLLEGELDRFLEAGPTG